MRYFLLLLLVVILILPACQATSESNHNHEHQGEVSSQEGEDPGHSHEGETGSHTHSAEVPATKGEEADEHEHDELEVSLERQKEWGIVVGKPSQEVFSYDVNLPGVITLNKNRTAYISTLVNGRVDSFSVDLGSRVGRGQSLLILNSPEFAQLQADLIQTRAQLNLSRIDVERARKLLEENAIEGKEFLRREAEFQKLSAEYGGIDSRLHSLGITHKQIDELLKKCESLRDADKMCEMADPKLPILTPLSGTVIFRDVILGEHVEPSKVLFTVSDLKSLWAELDAYEKDIPFITKDSVLTIMSSTYPEREFRGRITYIQDIVDERLRTVKIRAVVDNSEGLLKPNMFVTADVRNLTEGAMVLSVPEAAVQNLDGEKVVFMQEKTEIFHILHIELGRKVGDRRIILSGLKETDRLVVKGAFTLKAELNKGTFGHDHVH